MWLCAQPRNELGPVRESGIHRTQCRLSLSSRVASVRYTLTQRGSGRAFILEIHTDTQSPPPDFGLSGYCGSDPRRKGRYERWESRRSALASTACSIYSGFTDSHTFPTTKLCMCRRCEVSHPVPHPAHRALVACMCAPKVHEEHLSFDTIDGSCTVHDIQFTHKYLEV